MKANEGPPSAKFTPPLASSAKKEATPPRRRRHHRHLHHHRTQSPHHRLLLTPPHHELDPAFLDLHSHAQHHQRDFLEVQSHPMDCRPLEE